MEQRDSGVSGAYEGLHTLSPARTDGGVCPACGGYMWPGLELESRSSVCIHMRGGYRWPDGGLVPDVPGVLLTRRACDVLMSSIDFGDTVINRELVLIHGEGGVRESDVVPEYVVMEPLRHAVVQADFGEAEHDVDRCSVCGRARRGGADFYQSLWRMELAPPVPGQPLFGVKIQWQGSSTRGRVLHASETFMSAWFENKLWGLCYNVVRRPSAFVPDLPERCAARITAKMYKRIKKRLGGRGQ